MRIYGNGILKTRSVDFGSDTVARTRNDELHKDEIVLQAYGPNGEHVDLFLSLSEARVLVRNIATQLRGDSAG